MFATGTAFIWICRISPSVIPVRATSSEMEARAIAEPEVSPPIISSRAVMAFPATAAIRR